MKRLGLTAYQVDQARQKHGSNVLPEEKRKSAWRLVFSQLQNPLIYILIFANLVTLALGDYSDSLVIFLAVAVNTFLGFWQEKKVDQALSALKKAIPFKVVAIRDRKEEEIEAKDLVPGDLVKLSAGQKIPADGRLLESHDLAINEAVLTGESHPVRKKASSKKSREHAVYSGTVVVGGSGLFEVTKIGLSTKIGQIAQTLQHTAQEPTPLQQQLTKLAKTLAIVVGVLCLLIFVWEVLEGGEVAEMFELAVAIAVSAIPEGLIISLTVILAIGMQKIFQNNALVRRLVSAETLGATSVLCVDKTGTITLGEVQLVDLKADKKRAALRAAVLGADLSSAEGLGIWEFAKEKKVFDPQRIKEAVKKIYFAPFSFKKKLTYAIYEEKERKFCYTVGAPEVLLRSCCSADQKKWLKLIDRYSAQGYRLLGIAVSQKKGKARKIADFGCFQFLGLLKLEDPPRRRVKKTLQECRQAGLKIKIITGDYLATARALLEKIGIELKAGEYLEGEELKALSEAQKKERISKTVLFARTDPFQKLEIVQSLKESGEVVAMTGDGVNDALALKKADIGVVVAEGTQVAKETADMVLLDNNLSTIVQAIAQGRVIFQNIRKVTVYLLADSFTEVVLVIGALILRLPLPLLPVQILWVNLIADSFPSFALAFEKEDGWLMKQPPRRKDQPILDKEAKIIIFIIGLVTDLILLGFFWYFNRSSLDIHYIRSFIFAALSTDSLLYVFACKTFAKSIWHTRVLDNKYLNLSVLLGFVMLIVTFVFPPLARLFELTPLGWDSVLLIAVLAVVEIGLIEFVKLFFLIDK
ncbi:MAG: HAD-IC family P-type ATPase [Candidatus Shapirobacteria bacterium]